MLDNNDKSIMLGNIPSFADNRILVDRIQHMHGVAELMYQYYDIFDCKYLSRDEVYVLGLNHDIGYMNGKKDHEANGADLFAGFCNFGSQSMFSKIIRHHGDTPKQYMEMYDVSPSEIPSELILLWWADMNVESAGAHAGEIVGFQGRLDSLAKRYSKDHICYTICEETINWLLDFMKDNLLQNQL